MFATKEKLAKLDKEVKRLNWYCKTLDQNQGVLYNNIIKKLQEIHNTIGAVINELIEERQKREKGLEFLREKVIEDGRK